MNALAALLQTVAPEPAFCTRLTIALAHLVWQGLAIAALSLAAGRLLRRRSANLRYALYVAELVLLATCLPTTFCFVEAPPSADGAIGRQSVAPLLAAAGTTAFDSIPVADKAPAEGEAFPAREPLGPHAESRAFAAAPAGSTPGTETTPPEMIRGWRQWMEPAAPYATGIYFVGALVMSLRLMVGLWGGHRLRRSAMPVTDQALLEAVRRQARQIGLHFVPVVAWCQRISTPIVVGVLTPAILLPASLAGGLTPDQLSALFTHELAHIRRFDLVVNLLQRVVETLLFFHPAVWYLSRQISRERENCCDDCVLAAGWQGTDYAGALLRMAELCLAGREQSTSLAGLSAAGECPSEFKRRVLRLLGSEAASPLRLSRLGIAVLGSLLTLALASPALTFPLGNREVERQLPEQTAAELPPDESPVESRAQEVLVAQAGGGEKAGRAGLLVYGRVLDASTGKPVEECRVIPTSAYDEKTHQYTWQPQYRKSFKDGAYEWKTDRPWEMTRLRIEAPGYRPAVSRAIKRDEGTVEIDVRLTADEGITGVVLTPDGKPAAEAQLALATWTFEVTVQDGDLRQRGHAVDLGVIVVYTDDNGMFRLPAEVDPAVIVVAHESGYAEVDVPGPQALPEAKVDGDDDAAGAAKTHDLEIKLLRWGRVEGWVRAGDKPIEGAKFWVGSGYSKRSNLVNIHAGDDATSDGDGRFVVERVPPGRGWCQRHVPDAKGTGSVGISGLDVQFDLPAGACIPLEIGGKGRTVVGKVRPPEGFATKIDWSKVTLNVFPRAPHIGFGGDNAMWAAWSTFLKTDEGRPYNREGVAIAADGSFSVEGMPAADYQVVINVPGAAVAEEPQPKGTVAHGGGAFRISPVRTDGDDKPFDAGVFQLIPAPGGPGKADKDNAAAQPFEPIEGEVVDAATGKPIIGATVRFVFRGEEDGFTRVVDELKFENLATSRFTLRPSEKLRNRKILLVERWASHPQYQGAKPIRAWAGPSQSFSSLGFSLDNFRKSIQRIELHSGIPVTGRVLDIDGRPARGIKLIEAVNRSGYEREYRQETATDAEGHYRFVVPIAEGKHRGRIYLIPEHAAAVSRAISAGAGEQEAFQLRRGTRIAGRVTLRDGRPAAGVTVRAEGHERTPHRHAITDADGRYALAPLPAGDYDVRPTDQFVDFQTGQKAEPLPAVFTGLKVTLAKDGPAVTADFAACETVRLTAHFADRDGNRVRGKYSISGGMAGPAGTWWQGIAREDKTDALAYSLEVPRGLSYARLELSGNFNNSGLVLSKLQRGPDGPLIPDHHYVYLGRIDRDEDGLIIHYCQAAKLKFTLRNGGDDEARNGRQAPLDFEAFYVPRPGVDPNPRNQAYSSLIYDGQRLEFDTHPDEDIAFEIRRPGFKPFRETFRLAPGEVREVDVDFDPVNAPRDREPQDSEKGPKGAGAVIENGPLRASLRLERQEFLLGDSIAVEYQMTNTGQQPVPYGRGGYYPDLRWNDGFRISAVKIDEQGKPIGKPVANWPAPESHGGPVGAWQLKPDERYAETLFVTRVVRFAEPGRYRIRVENTGRENEKAYSAAETIVTLKTPTAEQAREVFQAMKRASRKAYDDNAMKFLADAADFETMHQPVYLPILREFALKGDVDALPSLERMETLEGNEALVAALARALEADDVVVARACYRYLQASLPFPNWYDQGNGDYDKPRRERSGRTWKAEFVPTLTRLARRLIPEVAFQIRTMGDTPDLLQKNAQPLLGEIDYIYRCVGRPEDFADCMKAYAQSIELTKTLPLEKHQYFRPRGSAFGFGHTVFRMMQRGAPAPTKPAHPGEAATFAIALRTQKNFRPAGWQAESMKWLKAGPPYLAEVILDHLPEPISDEVLDWLPAALASDYIDLAIAGCKIAEKHPRAAYKAPLQKLLESATEQYLVKFSRTAAKANGLDVPANVEE